MTREVTAKLRFLRIGPKKVRLVADLIRGKKTVRAVEILSLLNKRAARPLLKLLQSAMANAKNNFSLAPEEMKITGLMVDEGPMLKRWMPKARGQATPLRLRSSHITLILSTADKLKKGQKNIEEKEEKKIINKVAAKTEKPVEKTAEKKSASEVKKKENKK